MARIVAVWVLLALILPGRAMAWSEDPATPEGWAWQTIKAGYQADFNDRCHTTLDPHRPEGWDAPCRQIEARFLMDVLTMPPWQSQVPRRGVLLRGAHIVGVIDLQNAEISRQVYLQASVIENDVLLADAQLKQVLSFRGSVVRGAVFAVRMTADSDVFMDGHGAFAEVNIGGARIGGNLNMSSGSFARLSAGSLDVHGSLHMRDHASFASDVVLIDAKIGSTLEAQSASFVGLMASRVEVHGDVFMNGASFAADASLNGAQIGGNLEANSASFVGLNANRLNVHGSLFMREHASFTGDVDLVGAEIGSNFEVADGSFAKRFDADNLRVHGGLFMHEHSSFAGDVILAEAQVGGELSANTSSFAKDFRAPGLDVHTFTLMRDGVSIGGELNLISAKLGWLDLRTASVSSVDLSDLAGAAGSELQLRGMHWRCRAIPGSKPAVTAPEDGTNGWPLGDKSWREACGGSDAALPRLILRNAHIESFQDDQDAWPPWLDLEGLRYDRLGGIEAEQADMRKRPPSEWIDWLERDRVYSAQPYVELAGVLTAAGRREIAEAILYAGRERERRELWSRPDAGSWRWLKHELPAYLWLTSFWAVAGYGIGLYTFRVLWWVVGLTLLGAFLLRYSPYAREHSIGWRVGASLHRLLPIVELNKEFKDFFDNVPEPGKPLKLGRRQKIFFSALALAGWVLGSFLLAALGGLTPK